MGLMSSENAPKGRAAPCRALMKLQIDERIVEWIRFLLCIFRQDLQDYQDFFRLRRGVFRPKAALS